MNDAVLVGPELLHWVLAGLVGASGRHDGRHDAEATGPFGSYVVDEWQVVVHPRAAGHLASLGSWSLLSDARRWVDGCGEAWPVSATGWFPDEDLVQVYRFEAFRGYDLTEVRRGPLVCASHYVHWGGGEPLALEVYDSLRRRGMDAEVAWSSAQAIVADHTGARRAS